MPGYCTFTATRSPPFVTARCTWPMLAAANGSGSHSAKTSFGAAPSSSVTTCTAASRESGGAFAWSFFSDLLELLLVAGRREAVDVRRHLPELERQALHLAERLQHRLGGLLRALHHLARVRLRSAASRLPVIARFIASVAIGSARGASAVSRASRPSRDVGGRSSDIARSIRHTLARRLRMERGKMPRPRVCKVLRHETHRGRRGWSSSRVRLWWGHRRSAGRWRKQQGRDARKRRGLAVLSELARRAKEARVRNRASIASTEAIRIWRCNITAQCVGGSWHGPKAIRTVPHAAEPERLSRVVLERPHGSALRKPRRHHVRLPARLLRLRRPERRSVPGRRVRRRAVGVRCARIGLPDAATEARHDVQSKRASNATIRRAISRAARALVCQDGASGKSAVRMRAVRPRTSRWACYSAPTEVASPPNGEPHLRGRRHSRRPRGAPARDRKAPELDEKDTLILMGDYLDRGCNPRRSSTSSATACVGSRRRKSIRCAATTKTAGSASSGGWPEFVAPDGNGCLATLRSFSRVIVRRRRSPHEEELATMQHGEFFPTTSSTG